MSPPTAFLSHFGFDTLRDLPDMEALEDAGLLSKERLLAGDFPGEATLDGDEDADHDDGDRGAALEGEAIWSERRPGSKEGS